MIHLFDIGSILINIDQETLLRFLGIPDPNILADVDLDLVDAVVSTEVSMQTLKIVIKHLIDYYQTGFSMLDIENLLFFITTIRFINYSRRYNIETGAKIAAISFVGASLWYLHFRDMLVMYGPMMSHHRLTEKFQMDVKLNKSIQKASRLRDARDLFSASGPIVFLRKAIGLGSREGLYRIDPISMMVANVPDEYKPQASEIYYTVLNRLIPKFWQIFSQVFRVMKGILIYSTIVRVNKKRCPYFIRWHWTFIMVYSTVEGETTRMMYRLETYLDSVLIPADRQQEALLIRTFILSIISVNFFCLYIAMLHAACGQYFYVPFLTENTEIHIGKRPKNSIYSGGYSSWQEGWPKQIEWIWRNKKKMRFPRLWWGWFGNLRYTTDKQEGQYRERKAKRIKKRRNKKIRKFT